jgi:hypothetical protein
MKKVIYPAILCISIFLITCKPLDKLVSFNLETSDPVEWLMVPDSVLTDTFPNNESFTLVSPTFRFSDYDKFQSNKTTPQQVEDADAYNIVLTIDSGATNFGWAKDMKISISSPNGIFQDIELLDQPAPTNVDSVIVLELNAGSDAWVDVIRKNDYRFRTDFTLISPMPDTVNVKMKLNFRIKALPQKD